MHSLALIAVSLAGIAFVFAAVIRLRRLRDTSMSSDRWVWPVWVGIALLTVGLVATFIEGQHPTFRFGVLASWVAIAVLFFVSRFLTLPSRSLLVLPVGGMALLVALTGLAETFSKGERPDPPEKMPLILIIHIAFMCTHLAAMLFAGGAGVTYLMTARKLKTSLESALRLPNLSVLERMCERALVVATALLIGGLVTGGALMQIYPDFRLTSWPALSGMLSMAVLVVMLALNLTGKLGRRALALGSLFVLGLAVLSVVSVYLGHYVD